MTPNETSLFLSAFHLSFIVAIPMAVAFIHFLLFAFDRRTRQNLYVALVSLSFGLLVLSDLEIGFPDSAQWVLIPVMLLSIAAFVYSVFLPRQPKQLQVFAILAFVIMILGLTVPAIGALFGRLLILTIIFDTFRIGLIHWKDRQRGSLLPAIGMGVLGVTGAMDVLIDFGVLDPLFGVSNPYFYGGSFMVLTMSVHLAYGYTVTNADLERQLVRVRELIDQMLASERAAREQEIRRRLIEADNERKTRELEEARALQLSMLPQSLPEIPGLQIAASMEIASEVGGDYYDFHVEDDVLTIGIGDAVGHGMRAGIIVAATKAIFGTVRADESVDTALRRFDTILRSMRLPRAHMCFALVRIHGSHVEIANAGMPPPLHLHADGKVEEIDLHGPPLGVRYPGTRTSRSVGLEPGESLLLMSDGAPEARRESSEQIFGYSNMRELLETSRGTADDLVSTIDNAILMHMEDDPASDDRTIVAVTRP